MVEVDTFMELIANEYTTVIQENEQLNKQLVKLETELKNYKEVEKTLKQTLYNVQETSQISKENSQKEAILIKREAELAATQMLERARADVQKMRQEVISLHNQKQSFIARLKHVLSSQMELLEVLDMDDADVAKLKDRSSKKINDDAAGKAPARPSPKPSDPEIKMPSPEQSKSEKTDSTQKEDELHKKQNDEKDKDGFFNDIFGEDETK
jgi:cell division initiation protein